MDSDPSTDRESLRRSVGRWEAGRPVSAKYQQLLALVYDQPVLGLFADRHIGDEAPKVVLDPAAAVELVDRLRVSDVDRAALDALGHAVEQVTIDYSSAPAATVAAEAIRLMTACGRLLAGSPGAHHRRIAELAGWSAWIGSCALHDLGRANDAEALRRRALELGRDAGNGRLQAWATEIVAWIALSRREYDEALAASRAGHRHAPNSTVAVQLLGQEAEALARLGDAKSARKALERSAELMDRLGVDHGESLSLASHAVVDPSKARKSRARVARLLGAYRLAEHQARTAMAENERPDGTYRQPMRQTDLLATIGAIRAEQGEYGEAVEFGWQALNVTNRTSQPSLALVMSEIVAAVPNDTPGALDLAAETRQRVSVDDQA
ncbi:MAG: hypothetical protein AAGD35_14870 [Actinomycetota bacterium]